jgi:pimeloyl-ACP methyl ester carboxylesterase
MSPGAATGEGRWDAPDPRRARARTTLGELSYLSFGEGPAVVLLHGWPAWSFLWRREVPLLGSRMRVIAPDLLGYGQSDRPQDADLSLESQAACVRELLDGLGIETFAAVGHGFGGGVAQALALGGGVGALGLVDSVAFDAWPSPATRALQVRDPASATEQDARRTVEEWLRRATAKSLLRESELGAYLDPWLASPASLFRAVRGVDGRGLAGREADLGAMDVPTFVLWGEEDPFLPPSLAERLGDLYDGAMVALLPGCGHLVMEDAPQTVGPLLYEFLRLRYLGEPHGHAETGPVPVFLHRPTDDDLREAGLAEED